MKKPVVYVSGALTNSGQRELYEKIGEVVKLCNCEPYIPHQHTDPVKNPDVTPDEVYKTDMQKIKESDLVIAYVGTPSLGVGAELERANSKGIPIILLYEDTAKVSRLVLGIPSVYDKIVFYDTIQALSTLIRSITIWLELPFQY